MSKRLKDRIIKTLIKSQNLKDDDIKSAEAYQKTKNVSLERALVEKGFIKEQDLLMLLVRELNIPFIKLSKYKIDPALKELIPAKIAKKYDIIPLSALDTTITVALSDPLNVFVVDDLKNITGKEVDIVMSTQEEISKAIENYYGGGASVTDLSKGIDVEELDVISDEVDEEITDSVVDESSKAPIIRMVNLIMKEALKSKASDIHIEPSLQGMRVRFRIDGVLQDILEIPKDSQNAFIVRIKIMSRLDITLTQVPQDGRFRLKIMGKEVDFRVSLLPTTFGQKVVLRILDKGNLDAGLDGLGFSDNALVLLKEAITKPFGMLLITGPTGSGKSTTLYSIISELNVVDRNIITIEDPVEYQIDGLTQIQAQSEIGLTFAEGLKSVLRQSPDIVMVGEIRDNETADIAIKASLTGQLVFSTLHTNDSAGALTRLIDMEVEPFLVASSLILVSAQRLSRRVCPKCKKEEEVARDVIEKLNYNFPKNMVFHKGEGCEECRQTGYRGRVGITEFLEVNDKVKSMLLAGSSSDDIKAYAKSENNMDTLWDDAMKKCIEGVISLEEVLRVTSNE